MEISKAVPREEEKEFSLESKYWSFQNLVFAVVFHTCVFSRLFLGNMPAFGRTLFLRLKERTRSAYFRQINFFLEWCAKNKVSFRQNFPTVLCWYGCKVWG